jgi:hypothetical protein
MYEEAFPTAKIEIANAKICSICRLERVAQRGQQLPVDIVEDARHEGLSDNTDFEGRPGSFKDTAGRG